MTNGRAAVRDVSALVDDRPHDGVFRVHRDVFREQSIFELEIRHIFESTWVFLGLESDLPRPNDYLTGTIGRQPVVIMRDADGVLGCFINSCRHRGAAICHLARGNRRSHVCSYHGWVYDSAGRNVNVKDHDKGCYAADFDAQSHDLLRIARFGNYRGLLFGSLNADVPDLETHLGAARAFIDLFVDQGTQGIEGIPGAVTFTFDANWKTQIENGTDSYHFATTHASYIGVLARQAARRREAPGGNDDRSAAASSYTGMGSQAGQLDRGSFDFGHGHSATWGPIPAPEARPAYASLAEITARIGEARARWMLYMRNMTIFPNLQISENIAPQLRVIRPLAVNRTEMTAYCIGPIGESRELRRRRIRNYEEFFNPSGLATPDDVANYQDCQEGFNGHAIEWQQGYARGMTALRQGAGPHAEELGIRPEGWVHGPFNMGDETCHHAAYREWLRLMRRGIESESRR